MRRERPTGLFALPTLLGVLLLVIAGEWTAKAVDPPAAADATTDNPTSVTEPEDSEKPLPPLPKPLTKRVDAAVSMNPEQTVFLNMPSGKLFLRAQVACTDCTLEMLCCQERTKEHESIFSFRGEARVIHAGLLALGAKAGKPVSYRPEFKPPSGEKISIFVHWVDEHGKAQRTDVRRWLRHSTHRYFSRKLPVPPKEMKFPVSELRYDPYNKEMLWFGPMSDKQRDEALSFAEDKDYQAAIEYFYSQGQSRPMTADFVFAGSFHYDQDLGDGEIVKRYAADAGYLICVANFAESLIDVRENSSSSDGGLSYEGWAERIPPEGTQVLLELVPTGSKSAASANADPDSETKRSSKAKIQK